MRIETIHSGYRYILAVFLLALALVPLSARQEKITLGQEDRWADVGEMSGVRFVEGKHGFQDVVLLDGEYGIERDTELLLHFNTSAFDISGNYQISGGTTSTKISRLGAGSGVFGPATPGFQLEPRTGAMFTGGTSWGDFTIEFWLYPATLGEGDTIFLWQGSRRDVTGTQTVIPQALRCFFQNRALTWSFENIFLPDNYSEYSVSLESRYGLIPRTWHHHLLRYDSSLGLLEYLIDGVPEATAHTTSNGRESGDLYSPVLGNAVTGNMEIGTSFTGLMDEFRVSKAFIEQPFTETYPQMTGLVKSRVFDLEFSNSWLSRIDVDYYAPGDTGLMFYYRLGETILSRQEVAGEWKPFIPGESFPAGTRGRYLQVLVELFPDGFGQETPELSSIDITYEPDLPPHPPAGVVVVPGNGKLTVQWPASTDSDVAGYLVYYGNKPGQYFGNDSANGQSPIDAGNVTSLVLEGLENGKLYYIAVVSYDSGQPRHVSGFSTEAASRPSSLHRDKP